MGDRPTLLRNALSKYDKSLKLTALGHVRHGEVIVGEKNPCSTDAKFLEIVVEEPRLATKNRQR